MSRETVYEKHWNSMLVAELVLEDSHVEVDSYCNAQAFEELLGQFFAVDTDGGLDLQAEGDTVAEVVAERLNSA